MAKKKEKKTIDSESKSENIRRLRKTNVKKEEVKRQDNSIADGQKCEKTRKVPGKRKKEVEEDRHVDNVQLIEKVNGTDQTEQDATMKERTQKKLENKTNKNKERKESGKNIKTDKKSKEKEILATKRKTVCSEASDFIEGDVDKTRKKVKLEPWPVRGEDTKSLASKNLEPWPQSKGKADTSVSRQEQNIKNKVKHKSSKTKNVLNIKEKQDSNVDKHKNHSRLKNVKVESSEDNDKVQEAGRFSVGIIKKVEDKRVKVKKRKSDEKCDNEENKKMKIDIGKLSSSKLKQTKKSYEKSKPYKSSSCRSVSGSHGSNNDDINDFEAMKKTRLPKNLQRKNTKKSEQTEKCKRKKLRVKEEKSGEIIDENDIEIISDKSSDTVETDEDIRKEKLNLKDQRTDNTCTNTKTLPLKTDVKSTSIVDMQDVTSVLLMMEGVTKSKMLDDETPSTSGIQGGEEVEDVLEGSSEEEEESDWEEVEALPGYDSPKKSQIPSGPIEITVDAPQIIKKRKKKKFDVKEFFRRQLNRFQKEVRENLHKVHLMCLLARGMYLNRLCQDELLQAQIMSLLPKQFVALSKRDFAGFGLTILGRILSWFQEKFRIDTDSGLKKAAVEKRLQKSFKTFLVPSNEEKALVLILLLRSLGLMARLVMSLQPSKLKPTTSKESARKNKKENKPTLKESSGKSNNTKEKGKQIMQDKPKAVHKSKEKKNQRKQNAVDNSTKSEYFQTKNDRLRSRGSKVKPVTYEDSGDEIEDDSDDEFIPSEGSEDEKSRKVKRGKMAVKIRKEKLKKEDSGDSGNSSDSDFEEETFTPRSPVNLLRKSMTNFKNRKVISSDSEISEVNSSEQDCNIWAEVFLESEENYICIDCLQCKVEKPHVLESFATKPVHYVFSFDNDGHLKDLTPRYASKWLTETRKLRVQQNWLQETISPYKSPDTESHLKEDENIQDSLLRKALPTSISELKNHPLYVLKRHLLKFEAIYPNTAIPVGYIKNEPIYARECVYVLHSRENWLKEGRAVRVGEEPYKMVKSRPKWNRKKEDPDALDLETFGYWQTEVYIPPPAVNGKVPRNGYGNIELFMPSMLPAGTVHLKLPGLNKVAKKLNIDCVAAMTGWDNHCGFSHPMLDGFVVCEEYKDILIAAWDEDQEIQKQREAEKREKRVIQNWTLLTKGLLIREKLKRKYLLQPHLHEDEKPKKDKKGKEHAETVDDFKTSWPMNKEGSQSLSTAKHFETETL